ncbi:DUF2497 domain-containing protein [Methyloligella solikamskensis]|uniref:DUF2497 domain-containing protein n=1 Tax=Methyloligella solikamskensis TaxID=1177756 RepID=A0ABW3JBJ6_9HYPH
MSSTDRAPEPTMEEILASIRRIISEEENNDAPDAMAAEADQDNAPAAQAQPGMAEDQTAEAAPESTPAADADSADEPVEELTIMMEPEEGASAEEDEILELGDLSASEPEQPQESAAQEFPSPEQPAAEEPAAEDEPLELAEDVSFPFQEEEEPADTGEAIVRETSALEAAIAALKGDQARADQEKGQEAPVEEPQTDAPQAAVPEQPEEATGPSETPFPAEEASHEPSLESALQEAAAEDDDTDLESEEVYVDPEDDETIAENAAAFLGAHAAERRNGAGQHRDTADFGYVAAGGPLEETVKAMLRPMLREWLDQNMDRLLQEALHEELQAEAKPEAEPHRN